MSGPMESGTFRATDGVTLYGRWRAPGTDSPRAGVLIVHGYADHGGRYDEVSRRLAGLGLAVMAMDYRGHGQAGGRRGHCQRFAEFLDDFQDGLARVRNALGGRPLVVLAHSHGALIALRYLCDPERSAAGVAAVVLSSPFLGLALKVPPAKILVSRLASRIIPGLTLQNGIDPATISHDPGVVKERGLDPLCHHVATARWFTEATAAQEFVAANASRLTIPSLWLLAGDDRIADAGTAKHVYAHAGGEKKLHIYDGFFHEVFNESERARVFADLETWISSRFPAG